MVLLRLRHPKRGHRQRAQNVGSAANVVGVRMREHQPVQTINAQPRQPRQQDLARRLRVRTCIDQEGALPEAKQDGVSLAHVKDSQLQFTRRQRQGLRSPGRPTHRLAQHHKGDKDQKPNDRQRPHRRTRMRQPQLRQRDERRQTRRPSPAVNSTASPRAASPRRHRGRT